MSTKAQRRDITQNRLTAMSHPLRAEVLRILVERTASPVEMGRELEEETSNVSFHVKRLVELDCAELVRTRQRRGATEHFYRATERSLVSTEEWENLAPAEAHWFCAEIFQQVIDDFVASEKAQLMGSEKDLHLTRTPALLDRDGLDEGMKIFERARLEMVEVERRCMERAAERTDADERFPVSSSLALFRVPRPT
jgi:predicted transcriptional regulator